MHGMGFTAVENFLGMEPNLLLAGGILKSGQ